MESLARQVKRFARRLILVRAVDAGLSALFYLCFALAVLVLVENFTAEFLDRAPVLAGARALAVGLASVCFAAIGFVLAASVAGRPRAWAVAKMLDDSLGTEDRLLTCIDIHTQATDEHAAQGSFFLPLLRTDTEARINGVPPSRIFPMPVFGRRWAFLIALAAVCWATLCLQHNAAGGADKKDRPPGTNVLPAPEKTAGAASTTTAQESQLAHVAAPDADRLLIRLEEPAKDTTVTRGAQVRVTWLARAPRGEPLVVWLSLDSDNNIANGVLSPLAILAPSAGELRWNTGATPPGRYYICGQARTRAEEASSFAPGAVTIVEAGDGPSANDQSSNDASSQSGGNVGVPQSPVAADPLNTSPPTDKPPDQSSIPADTAGGLSPGKDHEDDRPPQSPFGDPERIPGKRRQYFVDPLFDEKGASKTIHRAAKPEDAATKAEDMAGVEPGTAGEDPHTPSARDNLTQVSILEIVKTADDALRRGAISIPDFQLIKAYFERLERLR